MPRGQYDRSKVREPRAESIVEKMDEAVVEEKEKASTWNKMEAFKGVEELPYAKVDGKGAPTEVFKKYYISGRELIEVYRGKHGQVRRICRYTFHPNRAKDKVALQALRKKGIPGA